MSLFDWKANLEGAAVQGLWVYFAAVVPLTTVVMLSWCLCTKRNRKKIRTMKRRMTTLSMA